MKPIRSFKRGGLKGLTCIIIIVETICLVALPVHATTSSPSATHNNIEITAISENTALVSDGDTISKITVSDSKVEVVNEEDSSDNLTLTIRGNQIHSSVTGETVTFTEDEVNALTNGITVNKVASKTHTEKIPYSKIKKLTSKTYSLAKIAAVIVSIYAAEGITLPYAIPIIVELLKDVTGAVDGVANGSSKHGFVIKRTYGKFYTFKDNVAIEHTGWHVTYIGKY